MRCTVKVIDAQDLPDVGDKPRYLRVHVKGRKHREVTTSSLGTSPTFNEEFTLTYPDRNASLSLTLHQSEELIDTKVASALVPLSEIPDGTETERTCDLVTKDGTSVGRARVSITTSETDTVSDDVSDDDNIDDFIGQLKDEVDVEMPEAIEIPNVEPTPEPEPEPEPTPEPEPEPEPEETPKEEETKPEQPEEPEFGPCRVIVGIIEARGVSVYASAGLLDPYCTVQITSHQRRAKTKTVKEFSTPVWNEEFVFHAAKTQGESITVLLKDDKEELAKVVVPLADIGESRDDWWDFEEIPGKTSGSIHMNIRLEKTDEVSDDDPNEYDPASEVEPEPEQQPEDEPADEIVQMLVKVDVVEARGLARMDVLSRSDPFCKVSVTTNPHFYKTKVIKNSLSPEWNDSFQWHVKDYRRASLEIEMFDWNEIQKNAEMARVSIPLTKAKNGKIDEWFGMTPVEGVVKGGEIHLVISMEETYELSDEEEPVDDNSDDHVVVDNENTEVKEDEEDLLDEDFLVQKDAIEPKTRRERLRERAEMYSMDPDEIERKARERALETYARSKKQLKQEFEQRRGIKDHPERLLFNNEENLEKEIQARNDPTQMSGKRLTLETRNLEKELEEVNAEIEQLNKEIKDLEGSA